MDKQTVPRWINIIKSNIYQIIIPIKLSAIDIWVTIQFKDNKWNYMNLAMLTVGDVPWS